VNAEAYKFLRGATFLFLPRFRIICFQTGTPRTSTPPARVVQYPLALVWRRLRSRRLDDDLPRPAPALLEDVLEPDYRVRVYVEGQGCLVNGGVDLSGVPVDQLYGLKLIGPSPFRVLSYAYISSNAVPITIITYV
jgi:hypothetical protein